MIPFVARRYLSTRRQPLFARFFLLLCLFGVAIGVFALVFVLAVMEGFEADFQKRVIGFKAPLVVTGRDREVLRELKEKLPEWDRRISRVQAIVEGEAVLQTEVGEATGVRIRGVDPASVGERFGEIYESERFARGGVLLGAELADTIKVHPDFFEKVRLVFPFGEVGPTGELLPKGRSFTVTGTFRSGFYDYDSKYLLVEASEAADFLGDFGRLGLEVWVEPFGAATDVARILGPRLPPGTEVRTWREQNPKLFAAMKLERIGMGLLLSVFLLIASFNIYGLISLSILEKIRGTAVMRCLGLTARQVALIFLTKAGVIGLAGAAAGGAVGLGTVWFFQRYPIRLPQTYYVEFLPLLLDFKQVLFFIALAPLIALMAALYPAVRAARRGPVEVLRYE